MKFRASLIVVIALLHTLFSSGQEVAVGSIGGTFAVSEMGAATYTIPIECPQGVNGMTPDVALTYNSQAGNGVCGLGFSISGLSVITRVPRTVYYDGTAKGIQYDSTDAYAIDGKRLILVSGTDGKDGAKYGLEDDQLTEVTYHDSADER